MSGVRRGRIFLVLWLLLASCSGSGAMEQGTARPEAGRQESAGMANSPALTLELQLSGGIAGRNERLRLTDDGRALVLDHRLNRAREIKLSPARQKEIAELVAALDKSAADDVGHLPPSRCRDCLVYKLILPATGKPRQILIVSDRLPDSPYRELISTLLALMKEVPSNNDR